MIRLQFVRGSGLSSAAIAWFSQGTFSHVDAVLPDGTLLGARSDVCGGQPPGVRVRPHGYEVWTQRVVFSIPASDAQAEAWEAFLRSQVGKPYDKIAILGFALGRDWRDDGAWICSELGAAALEATGIVPQLYLAAAKITPEALALVCSAIGGTAG